MDSCLEIEKLVIARYRKEGYKPITGTQAFNRALDSAAGFIALE